MSLKNKKHISFSEYRVWNSCSFKHYLTKQLGYSEPTNEFLVFGTAVHAALEDIAIKRLNRITYEKLMNGKLADEARGLTLSPFFLKKLAGQGFNILKEVDFQERFKEYDVVGCELEIYEPLYVNQEGETVYFKGIIDLVLKHKVTGKVMIADYKTAMRPWDMNKKLEDKSFFSQLALYKHFYSKIHGVALEDIETRFIVLVRDPVAAVETVDVTITDDFMAFTLNDVVRTIKEIIVSDETTVTKAKCTEETKGNCQYCFFHKNKMCTADPKQLGVEPYVKPVEVKE